MANAVADFFDRRLDGRAVPMAMGDLLVIAALFGAGTVHHNGVAFVVSNPDYLAGAIGPFLLGWVVAAPILGAYAPGAAESSKAAVPLALRSWLVAVRSRRRPTLVRPRFARRGARRSGTLADAPVQTPVARSGGRTTAGRCSRPERRRERHWSRAVRPLRCRFRSRPRPTAHSSCWRLACTTRRRPVGLSAGDKLCGGSRNGSPVFSGGYTKKIISVQNITANWIEP